MVDFRDTEIDLQTEFIKLIFEPLGQSDFHLSLRHFSPVEIVQMQLQNEFHIAVVG